MPCLFPRCLAAALPLCTREPERAVRISRCLWVVLHLAKRASAVRIALARSGLDAVTAALGLTGLTVGHLVGAPGFGVANELDEPCC